MFLARGFLCAHLQSTVVTDVSVVSCPVLIAFPEINNMKLLKHIPYKGNTMNTWENLHIYKHKNNNELIEEQIQTNTKH